MDESLSKNTQKSAAKSEPRGISKGNRDGMGFNQKEIPICETVHRDIRYKADRIHVQITISNSKIQTPNSTFCGNNRRIMGLAYPKTQDWRVLATW